MGTHKNRLIEAVLMSTHNLCFRAKIRKKNVYPCTPHFHYIKVGCKGVFITRTCLHDEKIGIMAMPTKKNSVTTTNLRNMFDKKVFPTWQGRKVGFLF